MRKKVEIINTDFKDLQKIKNLIIGDDCFFCIGTTKKNSPDKNEYRRVELDLPKKIAQISKSNNVKSYTTLKNFISSLYDKALSSLSDNQIILFVLHFDDGSFSIYSNILSQSYDTDLNNTFPFFIDIVFIITIILDYNYGFSISLSLSAIIFFDSFKSAFSVTLS